MDALRAAGFDRENAALHVGWMRGFILVGQRHFNVDQQQYKHEAQASGFGRKVLTRLRFEVVSIPEVVLSN